MPFEHSQVEPFRCEVEPARASVNVRPIGELNLATAPVVEAELGELWSLGFTRLALDLRKVRFLDSTGLRLVMAWAASASADGFAFGVIPGPPEVQRLFELAGVAGHVTLWSADVEARASKERRRRCLRTPHPGDEVDLLLHSDLSGEPGLAPAAARVSGLRARGVNRLRVRVVKAPQLDLLSADDAVKIAAPELLPGTSDPTFYVRLKFLDVPTADGC
jgi:anti-sigma B factor antagonist